MIKDSKLLIFCGAGFSRTFDFPDMSEAWNLCLSKASNNQNVFDVEKVKRSYPFSYFLENNIKDFELLINIWEAHLQNYYRVFKDSNSIKKGEYKNFLLNFCMHLEEKENTLIENHEFIKISNILKQVLINSLPTFWTVNYDRVIERLIHATGTNYNYLNYNNELVPIRKPHGSINWLLSDPVQREDGWMPDKLFEVDSQGDLKSSFIIEMSQGDSIIDFRNEPIPFISAKFPIIIPPIVSKEYHGVFQRIISFFGADMDRAENMIIIGYSFRESDLTINVLIRDAIANILRKNGKVFIINPKDDHKKGLSSEYIKIPEDKVIYFQKKFSAEIFQEILDSE